MVQPRLFVGPGLGLCVGAEFALPQGPARHVQVLRLQPGSSLSLFDGSGGEWTATVSLMGKREVRVVVGTQVDSNRELALRVTLALGMPANERMDTVVEKATELGVFSIQPLMCERSVLRLDGERAMKKVAHWQAVAVSACEQAGRTYVPTIQPVLSFKSWMAQVPGLAGFAPPDQRGVLSLREARWVGDWLPATPSAQDGENAWAFLSGPEGGLSEAEEELARAQGWTAVSLGARVLRADTAPITVMGLMATRLPPGANL